MPEWMNGKWIEGKVKSMTDKPTCFGKQPVPTSHLYAERRCGFCDVNTSCADATYRPLTDAEKWLRDDKLGTAKELPDADAYNFADGSFLEWVDKGWVLGVNRTTPDKAFGVKVPAIGQVWVDPSSVGSLVITSLNDEFVVCNVLGTSKEYVTPRSRFENRTDYTIEPAKVDANNHRWKCHICDKSGNGGRYAYENHTCGKPLSDTVTFSKTSELGRKTDKDKPRWSLLPLHTIAQVIKVLEFGAAKYSVGNWSQVPEARTRYYDATMRHIEAWWLGEKNDPESGLPHLAHAVACILFLQWFDNQGVLDEDKA